MFYTGLVVLIMIAFNFMICSWQWWINNCFEYVCMEMKDDDDNSVNNDDNSENDDENDSNV